MIVGSQKHEIRITIKTLFSKKKKMPTQIDRYRVLQNQKFYITEKYEFTHLNISSDTVKYIKYRLIRQCEENQHDIQATNIISLKIKLIERVLTINEYGVRITYKKHNF